MDVVVPVDEAEVGTTTVDGMVAAPVIVAESDSVDDECDVHAPSAALMVPLADMGFKVAIVVDAIEFLVGVTVDATVELVVELTMELPLESKKVAMVDEAVALAVASKEADAVELVAHVEVPLVITAVETDGETVGITVTFAGLSTVIASPNERTADDFARLGSQLLSCGAIAPSTSVTVSVT